jgi:hypothetical protein
MKNIELKISLDQLKEYLFQRSTSLSGFYQGMRRAYFLRSFLLFISCSWFLPSFRYKNGGYLISSINHFELIESDDRAKLVLVGGPVEFIYALRYRCGFINTSNLYILISLNCFTFMKLGSVRHYFSRQFCEKLSHITQLKFLLIDSDGLPYKRALCLLAQTVGKKVVCLQHGIFPNPMPIIDGSLCNLNLIIDSDQLSVFINSGLSRDTLVLLSEVSREVLTSVDAGLVKPKVILVGEGWVSHDFERHKLYKAALKNLKSQLRDLKVEIVYRPHPSERYSVWTYYDLLPIEFAKRSKNILPWNVYIGTMSSLLVEAAKMGASAIQLTNLFPLQENYEKYGVIQSISEDIRSKVELLNLTGSIGGVVLHQKSKFLNLKKIAHAIPNQR